MAKADHVDALSRGVSYWNDWRAEHPTVCPDLSDIDLSRRNFRGANFKSADFRRANLRKARLRESDFTDADLSGAKLQWAVLSKTILVGAKLVGTDLNRSSIRWADATRANFRGANLKYVSMVGTIVQDSILSGSLIYGISAWNLKGNPKEQKELIITHDEEPIVTVDDLEVAQFIYLLLNNQKIRHVIDTITSKVVLILGRFTPERKTILDAIREELRNRDYLPILFDFEKPLHRDITETVSTLAHMSRFVIADLSDPKSIPHELAHVAPLLPSVPIMPLIVRPQKEYAMFEHFFGFQHVLKPFRYRDESHLLSALEEKVIAPAEKLALRVAGKRTRR